MRVPVPGRRWSPVESQKGPVVMLYLVILVQLKNETSMIAATGCPLHQPMSQTPLWRLQGRGGERDRDARRPHVPQKCCAGRPSSQDAHGSYSWQIGVPWQAEPSGLFVRLTQSALASGRGACVAKIDQRVMRGGSSIGSGEWNGMRRLDAPRWWLMRPFPALAVRALYVYQERETRSPRE